MVRFSISQLCRIIIFASFVGFLAGSAEGLVDILFGTLIDSRWVRGNFDFSTTTKILYIVFNASLYMLFFQLLGAIVSFVRVGETKSEILKRLPRNEVLPYWLLSWMALGIAVFANVNETLWDEIELFPISAIIVAHIVFIVLVPLQIRSFQKATTESAPGDLAVVKRKNEARTAAYIILAVASLFVPDASEKLASPFVRCISLLSILVLVYPLTRLIERVLTPYYRGISTKGTSARFASVSAIILVLIPSLVFVGLAQQPTNTSFLSLFARILPKAASQQDGNRKPNVIILMIDMLRADHVHSYGYHLETTPNIDRYAREGVMFTTARAQASWTLPSTTTMLSGLYPSTHGATGVFTSISDNAEMLAEIFKRSGYTTAALVSNPVLKRSYNVHQGFDYYYDDLMSFQYLPLAMRNACLPAKSINAAASARILFTTKAPDVFKTPDIHKYGLLFRPDKVGSEVVNAGAIRWLKKFGDRPFFLYLHYLDVHGPYMVQRPFEENFSGSAVMARMNLYDGALRYTDAQIESFIQELDRLGLLENSIIMITSDHGEEFNDHGSVNHGYNLFEEQLQIPLVFLRTEAFPFNATVDQPVGLIDIIPTIVTYLGLESPTQTKDGRDFSALLTSDDQIEPVEYQYAETQLETLHRSVIYQDRWKFIWSKDENGRQVELLYDLAQDNSEQINLVWERPQIASHLREKLHEAFAEYESRAFAVNTIEPDEKTRQALQALGYIE
jgi:arylsulfatase A-like enzyme